ncbi:hypothetical protein [Hymenobacter sp. BT730]|uniref:hypothetical protein n=1 Tax=Hymenobacter sp. BT730 TaxID=3063332 RepID=UPI0026DEDA25|nr:hypothetical protein [Hymenobacter sp. BT730]
MQKNPNDGSNDNPDEFSELRNNQQPDNIRRGTSTPAQSTSGVAGQDASVPNTSATTPSYGEFGAPQNAAPVEGVPGGVPAPSTPAPEQRGSAPQNLATGEVKAAHNAESDERRASYKEDDPRYGSGTRNWETREPANRSNGSEDEPSRLDQNV